MSQTDPPKKKSNFWTILAFMATLLVLFDPRLRTALGNAVGFVFEPVIGFDHQYPVLTILIAGSAMVVATSVVRHFTTDWLAMARNQAYMRAFQKEFAKARKENNTFKVKKLQEQQPEVMKMQQQMSSKQLKTMPLTMLIVIPLFAWMFEFIQELGYTFYTVPWNPRVDMFTTEGILFGSSLFPHWILLYMVLTVPLGILLQKAMKYLAWKERWKDRHPDVHE